MAIDKKKKQELVGGYRDLMSRSQALILAEYHALPMSVLNGLRNSVRSAGGGLHATKNTLAAIALREAGMAAPEDMLLGPTLIGFCFGDISAVAKAMLDFARENEDKFTVKGAIMGQTVLGPADVKALATLPPLNVLRGQIIGLLQAPAARLLGVLSAPARQLATVFKAYAEKEEKSESPAAETAAA